MAEIDLEKLGLDDFIGMIPGNLRAQYQLNKQSGWESCVRCGRKHTGLCGLPPGVTRGYGARPKESKSDFEVSGKPKVARKNGKVLNALLSDAKEQLAKVTELLQSLPSTMPEYAELLDRESKLNSVINQLEQQIERR